MKKKYRRRVIYIGFIMTIEVVTIVLLGLNLYSRNANSQYAVSNETNHIVDTSKSNDIHNDNSNNMGEQPAITPNEEEGHLTQLEQEEREELLNTANRLALEYNYESAIETITNYEGDYTKYEDLQKAVETYQAEMSTLVPYTGEISHIFFHSLIADNNKAFDHDSMSNGYNYWMTTVSEFKKMLEQMYERGYVLVSIYDVADKETVDGKEVYRKKDIYLPDGKKPLVLSQDDVNYYDYMKEDGFAKRLVIDEDGEIACEINIDGNTVIKRDYDVVPIVDNFIKEHPDFSYKGAKGILAVTGYEGVLGYRTNHTESETYEEDKETVKKLAKLLKEDGWIFASHSYGHPHLKEYPLEKFKRDADKWKNQVESLVGNTDIFIYPYGEEIDYNGEKYSYLKEMGFSYFCGVYARPWMEITDDYVRMTRRNLDGFTMHFYPDRVKDLFDLEEVYDQQRPEFK